MKKPTDLIDDLMKIHPRGFDLSLDRITRLLEKLGNPHEKIPPVVHVAGTNGKGSTIAFCRSILEAAGLCVHVHTSPHLVNWHERYRIGQSDRPGQLVDDATFSDALSRVSSVNDGQTITVFEILCATMFVLFSEHPADVCLVEVGLGGRFDASNVIADPAVTVITPVSMDHEAYLGDTLAKVAFEKAGIIKRGAALVCGPQEEDALRVIEKQAARMRAPVQYADQDFAAAKENNRMIWQGENHLFDLALPSLPGDHQIENAATAIAACLMFATQRKLEITNQQIETGLKNAEWPGRMQALKHGKLFDQVPIGSEIWLDGGHNPGAAQMVERFLTDLQRRDPRPLVLICAMLTTKDPTGYLGALKTLSPDVIPVPLASTDSGFSADDLAQYANDVGLKAIAAKSLIAALENLQAYGNPRIMISGSLYLVGDALQLNETPPT